MKSSVQLRAFALGGTPGYAHSLGSDAPAISTDGQVVLYGHDVQFPEDAFYTLQSMSTVPALDSWFTTVGDAYRLVASDNAPQPGTEITPTIVFNYLEDELPSSNEDWLALYYRPNQPDEGYKCKDDSLPTPGGWCRIPENDTR